MEYVGYLMIASLFVTMFIFCAKDIGLIPALIVHGAVFGFTGWILIAAMLIGG